MNRETTDFLTSQESTEIADDIADIMDDTQVSVAVTYKDFLSKVRVPATGVVTSTYTNSNIRGVRTELSAREVQVGAGLYQVGDVSFMFAQSDLPVTPTREDQIGVGSDTYEILNWESDPLSKTWRIVARRVK